MTLSSLLHASCSTVGGILLAMALIALVEAAIPLHARTRRNRDHLVPNLALTFITFGTNVGLNIALVLVLAHLDRVGFGILPWTGLPPWVANVLAFIALDLSFYVAHLAMHKVPLFWRVHRVHHSDPAVDVTTTIRQHPLEGLIRYTFMAAFACAFGVGLFAFSIYRAWSAMSGLLEHSNIRIPRWLDTTLSLVTTWPNMHKIHHSRDVRETNTNYGNIFSWFDRLFGTYTPSIRGETVVCGLDELDDARSQSLRGLLTMPFANARHVEPGARPSSDPPRALPAPGDVATGAPGVT
jgi:sterol desaturase/sphingolipid hydroxylase (fatty acid hydroxylase superfamily)